MHGKENSPVELQVICGRENGVVYYAVPPLTESMSATWLLRNLETVEKVYSRLPLLATPSLQFCSLCPTQKAISFERVPEEEEETTNSKGIYRDGLMLIGPDALPHLKIDEKLMPDGLIRSALQIRGILYLAEEKTAILVKGMVTVASNLGSRCLISDACVKCESKTLEPFDYGIDIVRSTATPCQQPCYTPCQQP